MATSSDDNKTWPTLKGWNVNNSSDNVSEKGRESEKTKKREAEPIPFNRNNARTNESGNRRTSTASDSRNRSQNTGRTTRTGSGNGRNGGNGGGSNGGNGGFFGSMDKEKRNWIIAIVASVILILLVVLIGISFFGNGGDEDPNQTVGSVEETMPASTPTPTPVPTEAPTETTEETYKIDLHSVTVPDYVMQDFIEPNEYSRPQTPLKKVNNIVVHYVGNPGTSAQANVNYFKSLADTQTTKASSHFVVGLDGEIIQCVPLYEISYCSNNRNSDTIAIECCHPDEGGKFNEATYWSLVDLLAYLCNELELTQDDLIRHYDVTGKLCPIYYVNNPDAWEQLKADVGYTLKTKY